MLHRLSLRILPQLNALVTDPPVRRRKRWVMLAPGLVAFVIYRLLKQVLPLGDPLVLLALSGILSAMTAVWAFQQGRGISCFESFQQDGWRRWVWLIGWVGMAYGMQLSLLVLALLQIFVNYDFLVHPEGPAMMAIIIACTSVTRDAFEIGYVQRMSREGVPVPTFPDGLTLREWIGKDMGRMATWGLAGLLSALVGSWMLLGLPSWHLQPLWQSIGVPSIVATLSFLAFLDGQGCLLKTRSEHLVRPVNWWSGLSFWVWPAFTFSATYFLVLWGIVNFVIRPPQVPWWGFLTMAGITGFLMTTYTRYLGVRKRHEERTLAIPEAVQRCPFVMGILQNSKTFLTSRPFQNVKAGQSPSVR